MLGWFWAFLALPVASGALAATPFNFTTSLQANTAPDREGTRSLFFSLLPLSSLVEIDSMLAEVQFQ